MALPSPCFLHPHPRLVLVPLWWKCDFLGVWGFFSVLFLGGPLSCLPRRWSQILVVVGVVIAATMAGLLGDQLKQAADKREATPAYPGIFIQASFCNIHTALRPPRATTTSGHS